MKALVIVAIVAAAIAVFIFGRETLSYVSGTQGYVNATTKDRIPTDIEIARMKTMLTKLDRVIEQRRGALVDMQLQAEALEQEVSQRKARLAQDKAILSQAADMLAEKREVYEIGGIQYSFTELDQDAVVKATRFQQDKELVVARQKTLDHLAAAISDSRKVLSDAEVERQRFANKVDNLALRATQYATATRINVGNNTTGQPFGTAYASVEKAIADLSRKIEKGERLLDMRKAGHTGIDYAKNEPRKSGLAALKEVLQ